MISVARRACLLPLLPDLRHHRAMVKDESGGTNPWLRASKWLRISAWLPPGLALGWLAALVTLIHSVGLAVAAWGATVSVVLLLVLLVGQLQRATTQKHSIGNQTPAGVDESEQPGVASAAASAETAEGATTAGYYGCCPRSCTRVCRIDSHQLVRLRTAGPDCGGGGLRVPGGYQVGHHVDLKWGAPRQTDRKRLASRSGCSDSLAAGALRQDMTMPSCLRRDGSRRGQAR